MYRADARSEEVAKEVLQTIEDEVGRENVDLTLGYVGMIHSIFPVNAVYQWSRGPEEAILYVDLADGLHEIDEDERWTRSTESNADKLKGLVEDILDADRRGECPTLDPDAL